MLSTPGGLLGSRVRLAAVLLTGAGLLAACTSGSSSSTGTTRSAGAVPATSSAATSASSAALTIETRSGPLGTYLTDQSGRTVYLFEADTNGASGCSGACATIWPPVTISGGAQPAAGGSAMSSDLSTIMRSDGKVQVVYEAHPLYYFAEDNSAGATAGQGVDSFGAKWWVVAPSGTAITAANGTGDATMSAAPPQMR